MGTPLKSVMQRPAIYLMIAIVFLALQSHWYLARLYFVSLDAFLAVAIAGLWATCLYWTPRVSLPDSGPRPVTIFIIAAVLCLAMWAGTHWIMFNYPLTRDEHMVLFDGASYAAGVPAQPLPDEWKGYARALAPAFLLKTQGYELLVSDYLPLNAAMRGFFGLIADPALMNPLLVAVGFAALWSIVRHMFADYPSAQWVALLGYLLSAQMLVASMTTYAMSGHLAFNLVWLALFLKDRWWSHGLAMIIGVCAMGLHQFVFHPLFAGPFVLWLLLQRRWLPVFAYGAVYLGGLMLWMSYPGWVMEWGGATPQATEGTGLGGFIAQRIVPLLTKFDPLTIQTMTYNIVRAIGWNAIFIVPFLVAAAPALKRREPIALAALGGIALTLIAMTLILPYQGHGWGYRYVHGLIGSFCLLAAFGYRELATRDRSQADGAAAMMAGFTALIAIPACIWSTHTFTKPYAALTQVIEAQEADFVIVDDNRYWGAVDQVRNLPDLSNTPIVLAGRFLTDAQVAELCERGSVKVISTAEMEQTGMVGYPRDVPAMDTEPCVP